ILKPLCSTTWPPRYCQPRWLDVHWPSCMEASDRNPVSSFASALTCASAMTAARRLARCLAVSVLPFLSLVGTDWEYQRAYHMTSGGVKPVGLDRARELMTPMPPP